MLLEKVFPDYELYMEHKKRSPMTITGYMQDMNFFKKWLEKEWNGPVYLGDLTFRDVEVFLRYLREERNYKPASRKRAAVALKAFFKYAWKRELCSEDIASQIESVKCVPKEREYLTEEEALDFIKEIQHPLIEVFTKTLFYTGLRLSEALSLTVDDVDLESGWINIRHGKGNKPRKVPICKKLEAVLKDYVEWRADSPKFFATQKTGSLSTARVQAVIRETRKRIGAKKHITAHMFRHSFASQLVKKDVNIVSISKLLGHSNLKTTSIYTHASKEQLLEAISVL